MSKKYYWLKLKKDFFKRHDIQIIESMPNGKDYVLFYLKLLCESIDHDGNLRFSETIPYSEQMLATITNTNIDIVRNAISMFEQLGMIEIMSDGTYFMNEVNKLVGSETEYAEKKRLLRQKRDNVSMLSQKCLTEIEKEKDIEIDIDKEKRKTFKGVIDSYTSYQPLKDSLTAYVDMRKKMKGYTIQALELNLKELDKLAIDDDTKMSIVNQSISHTWKGFYELKINVSEPVYTSDNNISVNNGDLEKYLGGNYD